MRIVLQIRRGIARGVGLGAQLQHTFQPRLRLAGMRHRLLRSPRGRVKAEPKQSEPAGSVSTRSKGLADLLTSIDWQQ
ncbi:hypothetical protein AAFF_G00425000 [Aldrovandia affinis]|uniref:Uncharacterized protein n=1 Tax=Aldrovandia affinis TaxID=143900 RepID=A0AAD7T706_9TELE|nr:hypothetical protein AAFF_G00425000 [Aldrovandia affinis]